MVIRTYIAVIKTTTTKEANMPKIEGVIEKLSSLAEIFFSLTMVLGVDAAAVRIGSYFLKENSTKGSSSSLRRYFFISVGVENLSSGFLLIALKIICSRPVGIVWMCM